MTFFPRFCNHSGMNPEFLNDRRVRLAWKEGGREAIHSDPLFKQAIRCADGRSLVAPEKLENLFLILTEDLPKLASANIVEFGSYRGGSAFFMARILKVIAPDAKVYALDTFAGMPECSKTLDMHSAGDFADSDLEAMKIWRDEMGLDNLEFVQGMIEDTFPTLECSSFGLSHIDVDIYSAVKFAQDAVWDRMVPGGFLVYDDANWFGTPGATRAAEELVMDRRVHSEQIWPHWVYRR